MLLDNIADPARNYVQDDVIQVVRTDGSYPVRNPSTGGGGIDVVWKQPVLLAQAGISGLTTQESAQLAGIVDISKLTGNRVTKAGDVITIYEDDGVTIWRQYNLASGGRVEV